MIRSPYPGQRVQIWYRKSAASTMPHQGHVGVVMCVGRGPGPRNAAVRLDDVVVVVPRGNLREPQIERQGRLF